MADYKVKEYRPHSVIGNWKIHEYKGGGNYISFGKKGKSNSNKTDGLSDTTDTNPTQERKRKSTIYKEYEDPLQRKVTDYKGHHNYQIKEFKANKDRYNYIYFGRHKGKEAESLRRNRKESLIKGTAEEGHNSDSEGYHSGQIKGRESRSEAESVPNQSESVQKKGQRLQKSGVVERQIQSAEDSKTGQSQGQLLENQSAEVVEKQDTRGQSRSVVARQIQGDAGYSIGHREDVERERQGQLEQNQSGSFVQSRSECVDKQGAGRQIQGDVVQRQCVAEGYTKAKETTQTPGAQRENDGKGEEVQDIGIKGYPQESLRRNRKESLIKGRAEEGHNSDSEGYHSGQIKGRESRSEAESVPNQSESVQKKGQRLQKSGVVERQIQSAEDSKTGQSQGQLLENQSAEVVEKQDTRGQSRSVVARQIQGDAGYSIGHREDVERERQGQLEQNQSGSFVQSRSECVDKQGAGRQIQGDVVQRQCVAEGYTKAKETTQTPGAQRENEGKGEEVQDIGITGYPQGQEVSIHSTKLQSQSNPARKKGTEVQASQGANRQASGEVDQISGTQTQFGSGVPVIIQSDSYNKTPQASTTIITEEGINQGTAVTMATDKDADVTEGVAAQDSNSSPHSQPKQGQARATPVAGGVATAENANDREDERKWAEEVEEENKPKRSKSDLERGNPGFLAKKKKRSRSSGDLQKKNNGLPGWSEYYPTEYQGKQYKSDYHYDSHYYDLGDEYNTQYYGFGHSIFKNRKSVKREYKDPPKEKKEKKKEEKKEEKKRETPPPSPKPESPKPDSPPPVVPLVAAAVITEKTPTPPPKTPTPGPKTPTPIPKSPTPEPQRRSPTPRPVPIVAAAAVVVARSPTPVKTRSPTPEPSPPPKSPTPSPEVAPILVAAAAGAAGGAVVATAVRRDPTPKRRTPTPKQPTPKPPTPVKTEDIHIQSPAPEVAAVAAVGAVAATSAPKKVDDNKKLEPVPEDKPVKEKKPKTPPPKVPVVVAARQGNQNSKNPDLARESIARSMNKYRFK